MNKLLLKNTSQLSLSEQEKYNRELYLTLSELIRQAKYNQSTQEKFYNLELYFLQSTSLHTLFNRLLEDLVDKLNLAAVELHLVDHNNEIQRLIKDIYGDLDYNNLIYCRNSNSIEELYHKKYSIGLSQDPTLLNSLFKHTNKKVYSVAMLPLVRNKQLIGSLHLGSHNKERFVPGLATSFLQHLRSIIGICIENAVTQEQFKLLSLVDLLTRTKNRRYFIQSLTKEIARATRSGEAISCLFLDLDNFKNVNDTHGHLTGDRALQAVADCIMPMLRQSDVLARFGGEEFTIMLPNTNQQHAEEIAERIRLEVSRLIIADDHHQEFGITLSIGISTWVPNQKSPITFEEAQNYLISKADEGVYIAKEQGRNCVKIAPK
ncbi:MAG: DUF484 family protein [Enterobacterales bacterium]|nr:DUF484 family protein [Enterobacterales bacterium]